MITQKQLKRILHYDARTGLFSNLTNRNNNNGLKGMRSGSVNVDGYVVIGINRKHHYAHRLAWLYVYGYFPENDIDHKNKDKGDNRIKNLREISRACNSRNTGNCKNNTSGVTGVHFLNKQHRWVSYIMVNYKRCYLGYHTDFLEAVCHRLAAEQSLGWRSCNDSSPSFKYIQKRLHGGIK